MTPDCDRSPIAPRRESRHAGDIRRSRTLVFIVVGLACMSLLAIAPGVATARRGGDDGVRVAGTCGGGVQSELKLKARDGGIEAELELHRAGRGAAWRVTFVQEGRVVWRGVARSGRTSSALNVERRLRDLAGADRVRVRAAGPRGITCRTWATLPGA
jgi:hypothetical protein